MPEVIRGTDLISVGSIARRMAAMSPASKRKSRHNSSDATGKSGISRRRAKTLHEFDAWCCRYFGLRTARIQFAIIIVEWAFVRMKVIPILKN